MLFEKQAGGQQQVLIIIDDQYAACVFSHGIFLSILKIKDLKN
jgi:hypothetical protein